MLCWLSPFELAPPCLIQCNYIVVMSLAAHCAFNCLPLLPLCSHQIFLLLPHNPLYLSYNISSLSLSIHAQNSQNHLDALHSVLFIHPISPLVSQIIICSLRLVLWYRWCWLYARKTPHVNPYDSSIPIRFHSSSFPQFPYISVLLSLLYYLNFFFS